MKSILIILSMLINLIASDNLHLMKRLKSGDTMIKSIHNRQQCVVPKEFTKLEHPLNQSAKNILKGKKSIERIFSKNLKALLPLPDSVKVRPNFLKKKINLVYKFK